MALLTVDTVCQFVKAQLQDESDAPLDLSRPLKASEVTGGNLNYAFVVRDDKNHAVFVKQAPDYIKVIGPAAQLTRERMRLEVQVYQEWIQGGADISEYMPRIWKFDAEAMAFIMEFLGSYELLQQSLFKGDAQSGLTAQLGACMAMMHSRTHSSKLDTTETQRLASSYENRLLRDIQLEYVFSKCYREDVRAEGLHGDAAFMAELEEIKAIYNGRDVANLALCHGDLHAGSVMVDGESLRVKVIDPEFAIFGPPGLDVGSLLSTYILAFCFHRALKQQRCADELVAAAGAIWDAYAQAMRAAGLSGDLLKQIEVETLGFIGCEVARTALGLAFERSLRLEDADLKARAEQAALDLGVTCIRRRREGMAALTAAVADFALR